mgnify:FL=1
MQKTIDNHSELGTNRHIGRIIFLLPCLDIDPKTKECTAVGGFKVVYEYANRFAADGFEVNLVYPHNSCRYKSVFHCIRSFVGFCFRRIFRQHRAGEWFKIDKNIKKQFVFNLSTPWLRLKADDCVFATALETAEKLDNIKNITLDNKYYLIQGYELWAGDKEKLHNSYRMGMHNIVIAPWLKEKVEKVGATATLITNGFNFKEFTLNNPIEKRNRYEIVMLNHELEHKRCVDAWAALDIVKQKHPQLHVTMFGVFNPPVNMQSWYTYHLH